MLSSAASLALAITVADYFELTEGEARKIAAQVGRVVSGWRKTAIALGIGKAEVDRMASAFEHAELAEACAP